AAGRQGHPLEGRAARRLNPAPTAKGAACGRSISHHCWKGRTMDFAFTQEHEELRQTVRRFLTDKSDEQAVRATMVTERGYSAEVWTQMAEQLALQSMVVPEALGGAGFGPVEVSIVLEEMGRAL